MNLRTDPEDLLETLERYDYEFWASEGDALRGPLSPRTLIGEYRSVRKHQVDIMLKKKSGEEVKEEIKGAGEPVHSMTQGSRDRFQSWIS